MRQDFSGDITRNQLYNDTFSDNMRSIKQCLEKQNTVEDLKMKKPKQRNTDVFKLPINVNLKTGKFMDFFHRKNYSALNYLQFTTTKNRLI